MGCQEGIGCARCSSELVGDGEVQRCHGTHLKFSKELELASAIDWALQLPRFAVALPFQIPV